MVKIEAFKNSCLFKENIGAVHFALADNTGARLAIDDPSWATFPFGASTT